MNIDSSSSVHLRSKISILRSKIKDISLDFDFIALENGAKWPWH